jgi:gliding motility-associated-like protein
LFIEIDYPPRGEIFWSDNIIGTTRRVTLGGEYSVSIVSDYCLITDTIHVDFVECPGFIPNVFTPNGDSYNDVFTIENAAGRTWVLKIFDRWGTLVYFSANYKNDWDGKDLGTGVYYYLVEAFEPTKAVRGWVQILR